ncbi:MAG: hypothetical protein KME07_08495 [Pegethrix bostrychoides GSE-TBD4-15B]|jgi:hypothetical protein|uniref:Uncharacterized protein n=1 Tax=Pegethrix bostrychoides GSE-TBD4-15B TaxID=2839662 RepID=A0A951U4J1_9CYAN|nr:hypothetical protein [Pegethrix bostrychoides GSE-TBD4-15B]
MAPESAVKMDLNNALPPGSPERLEMIELIAGSSKFKNDSTRETFFSNSALAEYADSFDLSGSSEEFAERILPVLLGIGKLDVFLSWLLSTDKKLKPENKKFLKLILGEGQTEQVENINRMREESRFSQVLSVVSTSKKLDKQVLVKYGLREAEQIPKLIKILEDRQRRGVISIFLEGNRRITKEYIVSRIVLELKEQQGVEINSHPMDEYCAASKFNDCLERIKKKLEDVKSQVEANHCCVFLLSFSSHHPSKIIMESCFEVFLKDESIQKLEEEDRCFMFIWVFERSQFSKTEIRKLEKQVANFPICKIALGSFKNVIRTKFQEVGLHERLNECFERLDAIEGEFFPTYEYMDETFVNPPRMGY